VTGDARYCAVPGGIGEPVCVCEDDVREVHGEAAAMARAAADVTGKPFRVVTITESAFYPGRVVPR
jgi:hypothetical protein